MRTNISFRQMKGNSGLVGYIEYRLSFAFARLEHAIQSIDITISDVNGPKGGADKQCRVVIKASGIPRIVVSELRSDFRIAIDRSLSRASQSLGRKLKYQRHSRYRSNTASLAPVSAETSVL